MSDRVYRVTRNPEKMNELVAASEHVIVKHDDGSFRCATHDWPADVCLSIKTTSTVWVNTLDRPTYRASVVRTRPYWGRLVLARGNDVIFERDVTIRYDAPFGPDMEDIIEWERICMAAADDDYRRRGEAPPSGPLHAPGKGRTAMTLLAVESDPQNLEVTTESGTVYLIDFATMTWLRWRGPDAAEFRTTSGEFFAIEFVGVGEPMKLICPGLLEGSVRVITTTPVTSLAWS